jgi:serine/threonine protein kinase
MCPALITSGHVGKASDVYAFGIKLFEILTGLRPYAGVAVALLPHKVAVEGLRPSWPPGVPAGLRALAEACWTRRPEDRYGRGFSYCCTRCPVCVGC